MVCILKLYSFCMNLLCAEKGLIMEHKRIVIPHTFCIFPSDLVYYIEEIVDFYEALIPKFFLQEKIFMYLYIYISQNNM